MDKLIQPQVTIQTLQKHHFNFKKKWGQNFLIDAHVMEKIISGAMIEKNDLVLEIGPGIGTMTQFLCEHAGKVVAVEIDKFLIPILQETLQSYDNVSIINDDILKLDLASLIREKNEDHPIKVVANLPYYITTPIIMGLFEQHLPMHSITVMVQREVAERMQAQPGTKAYGALSLAVQYYAEPYIIAHVPPNCFMPRPGVGSSVIRLTRHEHQPVYTESSQFMFALIRSAFNQRRKTLVNALHHVSELHLSKEEIADALLQMGLTPLVRGETLTLEQFSTLSNILYKTGQ